MNPQLTETSRQQAWRIIHAMQTDTPYPDKLLIVRISCYLKKEILSEILRKFSFETRIRKLKKPFLFKLLTFSSPYCFYLYDIAFSNIYDLAQACNCFLMFEAAVLDRESGRKFHDIIQTSQNTVFRFGKAQPRIQ